MGFLQRVFAPSLMAGPNESALSSFWYEPVAMLSQAGVRVSPTIAMTLPAVWSAVNRISGDIGTLPCHIFRKLDNDGRERATAHALHQLLRWRPNPWQTAADYWPMMVGHVLLRGNAYSEIVPGRNGVVGALMPLHPDKMRVAVSNGQLRYYYRETTGEERAIRTDWVFHIRGLSNDGVTGMSVVRYGLQSFGGGLALQSFAARFWKQGATAGLAAIHPGRQTPEQRKTMRDSIAQYLSGLENAHGILPLEEGIKLEQLGIKPEDAQMLASRDHAVEDVARWFNLPLHKLGVNKQAQTYASREQANLEYVIDTLRPWSVRIEQSIQRDLVVKDDQATHYVEFLIDALMRGDAVARAAYYSSGIKDGWLTRNEARLKENLNPLPGLDMPLAPLNMAMTQPDGSMQPMNGDRDDMDEQGRGDEDEMARMRNRRAGARAQVLGMLHAHETAQRALRREIAEVTAGARRHASDHAAWQAWLRTYYEDHAGFLAETLRINSEAAREYAARHGLALAVDGVAVMEQWEPEEAIELAALAWQPAA